MIYSDGQEARIGDAVAISGIHRGTVVACLDRSEYSSAYPKAEWDYLLRGVLVETDFAGLVHYKEPGGEHFELISRAGEP